MNNFFIPFSKKDEEERMVYGYASTEALDSQGEIVAKEAIVEALPDYMKFGNIREMHTTSAVGKAHEAKVDEKGLYIGVKVVDESAWEKVKEGVYNGFSIGGKIITKINDTITKLRLTEISLVDRPANPEAVFAFYKGEIMADEVKDEIAEVEKTEEVEAIEEVAKADEAVEAEKAEDGVIVEKADEALEILKGFMGEEVYDAQMALSALSSIMSLLADENRESENNPEQISALQSAVKAIKTFIVSEIQEDNGSGEAGEEEAEEAMELSENPTDISKGEEIAKAGASISSKNREHIGGIIALCNKMLGEDDDAEKGEANADLAKGEEIAKAHDMLKSELDLAKGEIAKMADRIKELEAMPTAPKGVVTTFGKSSDYGQGEEVSKAVVTDAKGEVNEVASIIKAIHGGKLR